jgi:phosphoribosylamine--glycine ligase
MNILVIGSGGREHALAWAIAASPLVDRLYCAPGNAGIAEEAECIALLPGDTRGIIEFCRRAAIDFVVVGPEAPLVGGLVDALEGEGIAAFGPTAYQRFRDAAAAKAYIADRGAPIVVKADGLAAGKGVVVAATIAEAHAAVNAALGARRFGAAGAEIVVEECLVGDEASFFALVDGTNALSLAAAQDHKRVGDGDTGPNTGGMGAYSPAPMVTPAVEGQVMERIILPTVRAMQRDSRPFKGVLYAGLMLTAEGPKLIEYNVRFGDPECQPLIMRLKSDLLPALIATRDGNLKDVDLRWYDEAALCVVMAARGYPDDPLRGTEIRGLDRAAEGAEVKIFHAGTRREPAPAEAGGERLIANGGRVLGVTARGQDLAMARERAYRAVDQIDWPEGFCRRDIGFRGAR